MAQKRFKITPKHRRFIQFYVKTGNASEAGRLAGFTAKYGRDLMQEGAILSAIGVAEQKAGLSDELLLRTHLELLGPDKQEATRGNMLRLAYMVKKKIGSDEAPPPAVLPAVVVRIEMGNEPSNPDTASKSRRGHPADAAPRVSVRIADKP